MLTQSPVDVVQLLDDQSLAPSSLRCPGCSSCVDNYTFCAVWFRLRGHCSLVYDIGDGLYIQYLLGLQILDRSGVRFEVRRRSCLR
jgi:hypothetical protein